MLLLLLLPSYVRCIKEDVFIPCAITLFGRKRGSEEQRIGWSHEGHSLSALYDLHLNKVDSLTDRVSFVAHLRGTNDNFVYLTQIAIAD